MKPLHQLLGPRVMAGWVFLLFSINGFIVSHAQAQPKGAKKIHIKVDIDKQDNRYLTAQIKSPTQIKSSARQHEKPTRLNRTIASAYFRLVAVDQTGTATNDAIAADYFLDDGYWKLKNRYPLVEGEVYCVQARQATSHAWVEKNITIAKSMPQNKPKVVQIYPTIDTLPANQLKFYIEFSKPMREEKIFSYFQLTNDKGDVIGDPWRHEELWSADGKRLTLRIHPGRVKIGVNLREQLGPVLQENQQFTLTVKRGLLDEDGAKIEKSFSKAFKVGPDDRQRPNPKRWKITVPPADSRDPLVIAFDEPLDFGQLYHALRLKTENPLAPEPVVAGTVKVEDHQRVWKFFPTRAWVPGKYILNVDEELEDLAGNNLIQPFEVDLTKPRPKKLSNEVEFSIPSK